MCTGHNVTLKASKLNVNESDVIYEGTRQQLCSSNADCEYTGPGKYNCVCHEGYIGDGKQCERK